MKNAVTKIVYFALILCSISAYAETELQTNNDKPLVRVGMGAILSGDLAVFGIGDLQAAKTYLKHYGRHNIELIAEDARLTSSEGLRAYQKLINVDKVDLLIAAGTSNGMLAAKALIDSSKTVTFMASTGGRNVDRAGKWVFRIGNSDTLNGTQQAEYFLSKGITRVALLTELTEYTVDISKAFSEYFVKGGGTLVYDEEFLPNTSEFRSQTAVILSKKPQAVFMPTQTGTALGVFMKQLRAQERGKPLEVHTTMVAAPNPDAHAAAGKGIVGVYYMDPNYDSKGRRYLEFLSHYKREYNSVPAAPFHAASVIESLEHLQNFLDKYTHFDSERFRSYLHEEVGETCGYMGCYRFDEEGNSDLGFHLAKIDQWIR